MHGHQEAKYHFAFFAFSIKFFSAISEGDDNIGLIRFFGEFEHSMLVLKP